MNLKLKIPFLFFIIAGIFMLGCEKETSPPILHAPPVPEEKRLPVDYVFLLDNSGSIPRGEARIFAREAIKAFIDLTDPEDRASIILFDQDARVIATVTIQDEADRNHLKETVESQLTFQGSHTDISKGIALVRKESSTLFREPGAAKPAIILISDRRLEPKKNLQTAYQRLTKDWQALSDLVPFYTLGLGETEIYKEFLPNVTGHTLLTQMAEESGGRFYPVRSVEELVETCGKVLRHTKGYGEPAEQEVFQTDESTSRLAFLVIKRLPDRRLCRTGEILLQEPGSKQINFSRSAGLR